jgi:ferredoxin-NADP reductase
VSASLLLAYICEALLIQLAVVFAIMQWRRKRVVASTAPGAPMTRSITSAAWDGWREFRVARREYEDRAHTLCSFLLEPVDGVPLPPFVPGQFLTFALSIANGRTLTRCYSLSDAPNATSYRITVKRVLAPAERPELPPGACSNHLHDSLQIGDIIKAKAPSGRFVIDSEPNVPIVFIAGGIGITPLLSMLRGGLAAQSNRTVHLYYGIRHGAEHGFKKELDELALQHPTFHLNVIYSQPRSEDVSEQDYQHTGHVDIDLLRLTLPAGRHRFYVCGPPAMMESILPALRQWGVLPNDIHYEAFGPMTAQSAQASLRADVSQVSPSFDVMFRSSARTLAWDGKDANLLDFAERHDLSIESGCRSGSCGTCEVQLIAGTVRYAEKPDHEITPGHCLLCVGVPESALELEA